MPLDFTGRSGRADAPPALFVNRVNEADAFALAMRQHRLRMDSGLIDGQQLNNVLTFYGMGGTGKTQLSQRLADWVQGRLADDDGGWGEPPDTRPDAVVRWDLTASHGYLDPVELLLHTRRGLGRIQRVWPAFDLPFAALMRVLRPGHDVRLEATGQEPALLLSQVVSGLVSDAATAADLVVAGGGANLGVGAGQLLLSRARNRSRAQRAFRAFPGLQELTQDCERHDGSESGTAALSSRILEMTSQHIDQLEPAKRPLILVFVDPVERVQVAGSERGEATLNRLVASLPYSLFVMTGRNALRWHEEHLAVPVHGLRHWPGLRLVDPPLDEPRQHRIGNLSEPDAVRFLEVGLSGAGVPFGPDLPTALYDETDGWPLHMSTLVDFARNRVADGRAVGLDDLKGGFPSLVARLCEDLPRDEAAAFRAACLLPYFDCELAARAAGVTVAAVERLVQRSIVLRDRTGPYPYRVHDDLRQTVRRAGSDVPDGWAEQDWVAHARLAFAEARRRFDACVEHADDLGAVLSLALALNLCAENGIYDPWLITALRRSPTLVGLSALIPPTVSATEDVDVRAVVEYVHVMARGATASACDALAELSRRPVDIASSAALWRAYHLRAMGLLDDAVEQCVDLRSRFDDRPRLHRVQHAVTVLMARRYREAAELVADADEQARRRIAVLTDAAEGFFVDQVPYRLARARDVSGRRFHIELLGDWLFTKHLQYGVTDVEIDEVQLLADEVGHRGAALVCRLVRGQEHLHEDALVAGLLAEMHELDIQRGYPSWMSALLLGMRSLAAGDPRHAEEARRLGDQLRQRQGNWIRVEVLLEHLGVPMAAPEAQLTRPAEEVAQRWIALLSAIHEGRRLPPPTEKFEYVPLGEA